MAVIYIILDQDATLANYIKPNWPDLNVVVNRLQFFGLAYQFTRVLLDTSDELNYFSAPFEAQIAQGPMLSAYPLSSPATFLSGPTGTLLSDGDAPMYYMLLPNGLRSLENPVWGGWGGRFAQVTGSGYSDIPDYFQNPVYNSSQLNVFEGTYVPSAGTVMDSGSGGGSGMIIQTLFGPVPEGYLVPEGYPQGRWFPAIQNDMLSRSQWQTSDYAHANHPPVAFVPRDRQNISAAPGELVHLHGFAADLGYHNLTTLWWQYIEAGTYPNVVKIDNANCLDAVMFVPTDAVRGQTINLILQVTNDGTPPLTRYQRVVVTCR
jgi:hypothetical protein